MSVLLSKTSLFPQATPTRATLTFRKHFWIVEKHAPLKKKTSRGIHAPFINNMF